MTVYVLISEYNCGYDGTITTVLSAGVDLLQIRELAKERRHLYPRSNLEIQEYVDGKETSNFISLS